MISGRIPLKTHTDKHSTDLDPLQVYRVHDGALEELDGREVPLEQSLQFEVGWLPSGVHNRQLK